MNWKSPITAEFLAQGSVSVREIVADGDLIWWSEIRPNEKGRCVVCCLMDGEIKEMTPPEVNVDSRIHSYGGAAWWVENGRLYFQDVNTSALYMKEGDSEAIALTKADPKIQLGDGRPTPDGKYYICIRELQKSKSEPVNEIVAVPTDGSQKVKVLKSGADFYSSPRVSPSSKNLAWIQWNHPNMSWNGTELWVAKLQDKKLKQAQKIAGDIEEWIFQPYWLEEDQLAFVSDENNWSTLSVCDLATSSTNQLKNLKSEIATPEWVLGESRYCFVSSQDLSKTENQYANLAYAAVANSSDQLFLADAVSDKYSSFQQVRPYKNGVVCLAGSFETEPEIIYFKKEQRNLIPKVLYSPNKKEMEQLDKAFFPPPEFIEFATGINETAFGLYYKPANPNASIPTDSKPPLIVMAHGGPTAAARTSLYLGHRFWTSQGFAVLDVNYRGSAGFGRQYREALRHKWGQADVEDCVAGAKYLIETGLVNPDQVGIRGSSAGGLTCLLALAHFDMFACAAIRYGVVDIQALAETTHKFESHYLTQLVGSPYEFTQRSPISHIDKLNTPLLIMSGTQDPVVPLEQSQKLAEALADKGVKHKLLTFEGEGHGFRQSQNLVQALNAELDFFKEVFGI